MITRIWHLCRTILQHTHSGNSTLLLLTEFSGVQHGATPATKSAAFLFLHRDTAVTLLAIYFAIGSCVAEERMNP
jgi:hypothetical protein